MATPDDVIHFLAEAAPDATLRLITAGLAAGGLGLRAGSESADHDAVDAVTNSPDPMAQDSADCRAADRECIQSTPVNTPLPAPTPTATTGTPEDMQPRPIARATVPRHWPTSPNVDEISEQREPATPVPRSGRGRDRSSTHKAARRLLGDVTNYPRLQGVPLLPYSQRDMEVAGRLSLVEASAPLDVCRLVANDTWCSADQPLQSSIKESPSKFPIYPSFHVPDAATLGHSSRLGLPRHIQLDRLE
ncbi:unnamed protein product [Closterium sp. Yama58-4]|nr:unnamed protein product [Closterium sp. Yama58-4]